MSFLDRFQGKIATVTAQGHLKKADGSEEIRVGAPKRRSQPQQQKSAQQRPVENNNSLYDGQTMLRQPTKVQVRTDLGRAAASPPPPIQTQRSPMKNPPHESPIASPRGRVNSYQSKSARGAVDYDYYEPTGVPGRVRDDYSDVQPPRQPLTIRSPDHNTKNASMQNSPKECRSPREINEGRVVTEQDQLAFSRKARPVQYEPCKLSQYKKEKPDGYYELGKLQPDLNTDELVEKRAKNERIKAFSQNLRVINKNASKKPTDISKEQPANLKPKSSREKGLAFAKRVPKPRLSQRSDSAEEIQTTNPRASRTQIPKPKNPNVVVDDDSEDDELNAELRLLQQRHEASRAEVEALVGSV
ncbi:hypothetical protein L914_11119 [Phytophthora nicotianae]|uniref:Uncharacterized protein n=1 Tax=Phytophthora nicotianae TaxID=4792 RepID=W2N6N9_PHYNI|nr:hypothetical protein L914_11119 [Phytophthora nicotianae]